MSEDGRQSFGEQRVRSLFVEFEDALTKVFREHATTIDFRETARVQELLDEAKAWAVEAVQ